MSLSDPSRERVVRRMRRAFFDVASDDVLVYQDPCIGLLANPDLDLAVKLNHDKTRLELRVGDHIERTYDLAQNVAAACIAASGAYFDALVSRPRSEHLDTAAVT